MAATERLCEYVKLSYCESYEDKRQRNIILNINGNSKLISIDHKIHILIISIFKLVDVNCNAIYVNLYTYS